MIAASNRLGRPKGPFTARKFANIARGEAAGAVSSARTYARGAAADALRRLPLLGEPQMRRRRYRAAAKNKTHIPNGSSPRYAKNRSSFSLRRGEFDLRI
jgi:hypothetical protein